MLSAKTVFWHETLYYVMYAVGILLGLAYFMRTAHARFPKDKWHQSLRTYVSAVCTGLLGAVLLGAAMNYFLQTPGEQRIRLFGAIVTLPAFFFLKGKISGERVTDRLDAAAPCAYIVMGCAKIGCHFGYCCYGIPCEWGVYNLIQNKTLFPVQLLEAAAIFLCVGAALFYRRRKYFIRGTAYPFLTLLFCLTRFALEYLRDYANQPARLGSFVFGLTIWQTFCIIVAVLCLGWLALQPRLRKRAED